MDASEHRRLVEQKAAEAAAMQRNKDAQAAIDRLADDAISGGDPNVWPWLVREMNKKIEMALRNSSSRQVRVTVGDGLSDESHTIRSPLQPYLASAHRAAAYWEAHGYTVRVEDVKNKEYTTEPGVHFYPKTITYYVHSVVVHISS